MRRSLIGLSLSVLTLLPLSAGAASGRVPVTSDKHSDEAALLVQRGNGDLVTVFNSAREPSGMYASVSEDRGRTWSKPAYVIDGWGDGALTEDDSGRLLLAASRGGEYDIWESRDGVSWSPVAPLPFMTPNSSVGDLLQAENGTYHFTYSSHEGTQPVKSYVYAVQSKDLRTWSAPVRISTYGYSEFDSTILQLPDGSFLLAFNSYPMQGIAFSVSRDGKCWTAPKRALRTQQLAHMGLNLVRYQERPYLFYSHGNQSLRVITYRGRRWSGPKHVTQPALFGGDGAVLTDQSMGVVYTDEAPTRDIYFENVRMPR